MTSLEPSSGLWLDEPALVDLLAFDAVALTVADAVLDDALDPVAIGVSGSWGSGKTTVLRLVKAALKERNRGPDKQILVVETDPWRYDPSVGAKESLIGEVLGALEKAIGERAEEDGVKGEAMRILSKLKKRVNWSKALQVAAKTSLTLQLPSIDDLTSLINTDGDGTEAEKTRGMDEFRTEFAKLMGSKALDHLKRVVVLVDDLDRCLYPTVVGTLETIRLFLAVPRMSFVIAADEKKVAEALRTQFPDDATDEDSPEGPATLYLHKIVQTTVPLPALSRFDTEAYLVLLQLSHRLDSHALRPFIDRCTALRKETGLLDDLVGAVAGEDISAEMTFASRLTPLLYEKLRGNPRRIKRFLNDLRVRESVAKHRGIALAPEIIAKLMVLEVLLKDGFKQVLEWLAKGELRDQMLALESAAGRPVPTEAIAEPATAPKDGKKPGKTTGAGRGAATEATELPSTPGFSEDLLRWAKLPPVLGGEDLAPYLHLAASFTGRVLLDAGLPERVRDIAANLLSSLRAEQKSVNDADIAALIPSDALSLVQHLGRVARDRQREQQAAVLGLLRITRAHPESVEDARKLLAAIPAAELRVATVVILSPADKVTFRDVLVGWQSKAPAGPIKNALDLALGGQAS